MALGISAAAWAGIAAVASTSVALYNGQQQQKAQKSAQQQAQANALKQQKSAEEANNKASQKTPDTQAIMDAAMLAGKTGAASTLLSGTQGVDPSALQLGKATLLGGGG